MPKKRKTRKLPKCRQSLVTKNYGLVYETLYRIFPSGQPELHGCRAGNWDDAVQMGMLGLVNAAIMFDPKRGFKFSTYAVNTIRNTIFDWTQEEGLIRVPRYMHGHKCAEKYMKYRKAAGSITSDKDLQFTLVDQRQTIEYDDQQDKLLKKIKSLTQRYQQAIKYRYWDGLPYKEMGERFGVTTERARQITTRAMQILKKKMGT